LVSLDCFGHCFAIVFGQLDARNPFSPLDEIGRNFGFTFRFRS
jgi:hypothetical protein